MFKQPSVVDTIKYCVASKHVFCILMTLCSPRPDFPGCFTGRLRSLSSSCSQADDCVAGPEGWTCGRARGVRAGPPCDVCFYCNRDFIITIQFFLHVVSQHF